MAFGVGDSLSVRVSAQTKDFERGVERAKDSLETLSRNANGASRSLAGLGSTATGVTGSFGILSAVTTASLVPAIGALSTALFPLVLTFGALAAAAGGLVAAFGAVVGSGLIAFGQERGEQNAERLAQVRQRIRELENLEDSTGSLTDAQREELRTLEDEADQLEEQTGVMGGLQSAIQDVVAEIRPMIVEFGERFIPLIEDAIDAIPDLVEDILDAIGPLDKFKDALRDAGNAASDVLPDIVTALIDLGRRALPAARRLGNFLLNRGSQAFNTMIRVAGEFDRELINLTNSIIGLLPKLTRMGVVMLNTLIPPFQRGVNILDRAVSRFNNLDNNTKGLLATAAALAPVVSALVSLLGGPLTLALGAVVIAVAGAIAIIKDAKTAWENNLFGIRDAVLDLKPQIEDLVEDGRELVDAFTDGFDLSAVIDSLEDLGETISTQIEKNLPAALDLLEDWEELLEDNKEEFRTFGELASNALVLIIDGLSFLAKVAGNVFRKIIVPALMTGIDLADFLVTKFAQAAELFNKLQSGELDQQVIESIVAGTGPQPTSQLPGQGGQQEVVVSIDEDTELFEARVEELSQRNLDEQDRRSRRRSGTTTNLNR